MQNEEVSYERVGFIAINKDGTWKIDYMSYSTGEPTLQTAMGTQLAPLVLGLEKNKSKYIGE